MYIYITYTYIYTYSYEYCMYMSQGPWCTGNYVLESFISMVLGFNQRFVFSQKATVQLNAIRAKTRTATAKDVEVLHFFGGATDAVRISTIYIYYTYITYSLPFDNACFALFFPDSAFLNNSSTYFWNLLLFFL